MLHYTEKVDGPMYAFTSVLAKALELVHNTFKDISEGLAVSQPEVIDLHLKLLFAPMNISSENHTSLGRDLISFVTRHMKQQSNIFQIPLDKRALLFAQIAREVMFRYGAHISTLLAVGDLDASSTEGALACLSHTGAIRVALFALQRNIDFENCEKLVQGKCNGDVSWLLSENKLEERKSTCLWYIVSSIFTLFSYVLFYRHRRRFQQISGARASLEAL